MGSPKKQPTARAPQSRLQRRFRNFGSPAQVEDIFAEHVDEEELVQMVLYAKSELLARQKKYNLESTKKNLLKLQNAFDLGRELSSTKEALQIVADQLELTVRLLQNPSAPQKQKEEILSTAITVLSIIQKLLKVK